MIDVRMPKKTKEWNDFYHLSRTTVYRPFLDKILDVNLYPFYQDGFMKPLVAYQDGNPVARCVGFFDEVQTKALKKPSVYFSYLDSNGNPDVLSALMSELEKWSQSWGATSFRGPYDPYPFGQKGISLEEKNSSQIASQLERCGFKKHSDHFVYRFDKNSNFHEEIQAKALTAEENQSIKLVSVTEKNKYVIFEEIRKCFNEIWGLQFTQEMLYFFLEEFHSWIDLSLIQYAEVQGETAGFSLAIPQLNSFLKTNPTRRWNFSNALRYAFCYKGFFRNMSSIQTQILTVGVRKKYRYLGIAPLFYHRYKKNLPLNGYTVAQTAAISETQENMINTIELLGGQRIETRRIFEK